MDAFVAATAIRASVRPTRLAYLIAAGSRQQFLRAAEFAATEWGGITQAIYPLWKGEKFRVGYEQIAQLLRPDYVIDLTEGDRAPEVDAAKRALGGRDWSGSALGYFDASAHTLLAVPEDSLAGQTLLVSNDPSDLGQAVAVGGLGGDDFAPVWEATGATIRPVRSVGDIVDAQVDVPSPILLSKRGVEFISHSAWFGGPVIAFSMPLTVNRASWFWSQRSLAIPGDWPNHPIVIWIPPEGLRDDLVWERLRDLAVRSRTTPDLVLRVPDRDRAAVEELAQAHGFLRLDNNKTSTTMDFRPSQRDLNTRPLTFAAKAEPRVWLLGERRYGASVRLPVTITSPKTAIHFDSPFELNHAVPRTVRVNLELPGPMQWPARPAFARLLEANATFGPEGFEVGMSAASRYSLTLNVPTAEEVVTALLADHGWTWEVSDKGRYAQALAEACGPRVDVLQDSRAIKVSRALATLSRVKAEQMLSKTGADPTKSEEVLRLVADTLVSRTERWRPASELAGDSGIPKKDILAVLDSLLMAGLVRRALLLKCNHCGMQSPVPLNRVADEVRCEGCGTVRIIAGPPGEEPVFLYAINSLLDRALDQDCVSHILAGLWATQSHDAKWTLPGAVVRRAGIEREIDLLAVSASSVMIAEVKETPGAFRSGYIGELVALASELGADTLLLATVEPWPTADRDAAIPDTADIRIVPIDQSELFTV